MSSLAKNNNALSRKEMRAIYSSGNMGKIPSSVALAARRLARPKHFGFSYPPSSRSTPSSPGLARIFTWNGVQAGAAALHVSSTGHQRALFAVRGETQNRDFFPMHHTDTVVCTRQKEWLANERSSMSCGKAVGDSIFRVHAARWYSSRSTGRTAASCCWDIATCSENHLAGGTWPAVHSALDCMPP